MRKSSVKVFFFYLGICLFNETSMSHHLYWPEKACLCSLGWNITCPVYRTQSAILWHENEMLRNTHLFHILSEIFGRT